MKCLVVYKSLSGFTKKYAEWISKELDSDCIRINELHKENLSDYDFVVFGGPLHAGGINGLKQFEKSIPKIKKGKIALFAVGAAPYKEGIEEELKLANYKDIIEDSIPLFYFPGGFDFSKLNFFYKIVMQLFKMILNAKKIKTVDDIGMLKAYEEPLDVSKKENIEPLMEYINKGVRI